MVKAVGLKDRQRVLIGGERVELTPHTDFENLKVTTHPKFQAIMARSQARSKAEGGLTTEELRRRLAARRKARNKTR